MVENFITDLIDKLGQDKELFGDSVNYANWMSMLSFTTCQYCVEQHGRIVEITVMQRNAAVEAHPRCQCIYVPMRTVTVGMATDWGEEGADSYLFYLGHLPEYYIDKETARQAGWQSKKKTLSAACPGKMLGGDVFANDASKLPSAPGRVWYEADINYSGGKRNRQRILYSNDGLLFVTYDHYQTFYEITL